MLVSHPKLFACLTRFACSLDTHLAFAFFHAATQDQRAQWNVQRLDLEEGRRLEAVCRTDADPASLRLEIKGPNGQRVQAPLGLSFANGDLSLSAVTQQDNGLQFICSSGQTSDTLALNVRSSSTLRQPLCSACVCLLLNSDLNVTLFLVNNQDGVRSFVGVRFESRDEQSHQLGRDIYLQCSVQGNVERPHEYQYTKDGEPLKNSTNNENDFVRH